MSYTRPERNCTIFASMSCLSCLISCPVLVFVYPVYTEVFILALQHYVLYASRRMVSEMTPGILGSSSCICSPDLMSLFIRGIYLEQSAQKDYFWPLKLGSHISPKCDIAAGTAWDTTSTYEDITPSAQETSQVFTAGMPAKSNSGQLRRHAVR